MKRALATLIYDDGIPAEDVEQDERLVSLLEHGAEITSKILTHAVEIRAYDAVDMIIEKEKNVEMSEALSEAVEIGDYEIVMKLVESGADVNGFFDTADGKTTAMHSASWSTSTDILKYLIEKGGNLQLKDSDGKTPYDGAKVLGLKENIQIIKKAMKK